MKYTSESTNEQVKEAMEKWEEVYNLYHKENKTDEAAEKALELTDALIQAYISKAREMDNTHLQDVEDLEQSLKLTVIAHLPKYEPYRVDETTGKKAAILGNTFFSYWLKEAFSDYTRGGDGMNRLM